MHHRFNRFASFHRGALPARGGAAAMAALLAALLTAPLAMSPARAAELGDIAVRTYLNQPLTADIELVMLSPEEAADGVPVRMAGPNIYQGANVRMHPALAGARLSVQRKDQRLVVHIVTLQPIDTEVVHLYLELGTGSRAVVRAATLWLTPEPPGAPRPPVVRPLPAPVVAAPADPAPVARAPAAAQLRPAPLPPPADLTPPVRGTRDSAAPATAPAAAPAAPPSASPSVPTSVPTSAAVTADPAVPGFAPSEAALVAARARAAAEREAQARRAAQAAHGTGAVPGMMPPRGTPARAACTPGQAGEQARQCVALDQKNTELHAKIRDLEGKVRALQTVIGSAPQDAHGATAAPASPAVAASASAVAPNAADHAPAKEAPAVPAASASASAASAGAAASAASAGAASTPAASTPMNPAGAVIPPSANGTNGKKERRSGLNTTTQIVLGVLATLAVLGGLAYLVRTKKLKFPPKEKLMVWKRWKRNKAMAEEVPAEPQEPVLDKDGE